MVGCRTAIVALGCLILAGCLYRPQPSSPGVVAQEVTLEGRSVSGWDRSDVEELITHLARGREIPPCDPTYDPGIGGLIPGHFGVVVDLDKTMERVMEARPGSKIYLVESLVSPRDLLEFENTAVYTGRPDFPLVSLVVNVAWGQEHLPPLLEVLESHGARATFSVMGFWLEENPQWGREIRDRGHELAAHGFSDQHPQSMTSEELRDQLQALASLMEDLDLGLPSCYTPHYGERSGQILLGARQAGLVTVYWSIDTLDWTGLTAGEMIARVEPLIHPGAIFLLHPTRETPGALEGILAAVKSRGLRVVPVSRLIRPIP